MSGVDGVLVAVAVVRAEKISGGLCAGWWVRRGLYRAEASLKLSEQLGVARTECLRLRGERERSYREGSGLRRGTGERSARACWRSSNSARLQFLRPT